MIMVGIGANLSHPDFGRPRRTCGAALERLSAMTDVTIADRSRWYASAPVIRDGTTPPGQPWYVNGAVTIKTGLEPQELLDTLNGVEQAFGRVRSTPDAPRTLDLDILAFNDSVIDSDRLTVPHPRLHLRAFALLPMADLAPDWRHPASGEAIADMIAALGDDQGIEISPDATGFLGTEWSID